MELCGMKITRVSEGLGIGTNNDAQYRALIRGLKTALNMGYDRICVRGDSKLVCEQVNGEQHIRSNRLARYCDETRQLSDQFKKFSMRYCPRSQNTDADWEAQRAVDLSEGRIAREYNWHYESYDESDSYISIDYSSLYYDQTYNNSIGWDAHQVYLEFDGASRKNPGRAGAGAVLKSKDGAVITRVREGLGICTNNDAEYRALIRGLKTAFDMGYDRIHVKGDSLLVCKQVRGEWRITNKRLKMYCDEARQLSDQFKEFSITYCPRSQNAASFPRVKMLLLTGRRKWLLIFLRVKS